MAFHDRQEPLPRPLWCEEEGSEHEEWNHFVRRHSPQIFAPEPGDAAHRPSPAESGATICDGNLDDRLTTKPYGAARGIAPG